MVLETLHFNVSYGKIHAVKNVDITVHEHEVVTVIGANGAGKSSLLLGLCGIVEAKGAVVFKDEDISAMEDYKRVSRGLILCPEGRHIFPSLAVEDNLLLGFYRRGRGKKLLPYVYELFPKLKERRKQIAGYMSGGEQQMLAIGRALMAEPELLLLDEPSLGLAPILVDQVFEALDALRKQGMAILLVEQNAVRALAFADRGYILENGQIRLSGTGTELLHNEEVARAYLGTGEDNAR